MRGYRQEQKKPTAFTSSLLGQILVSMKKISSFDRLDHAIREQVFRRRDGLRDELTKIGSILIEFRDINELDLKKALEEQERRRAPFDL